MFMHTVRDDNILGTMRFVSKSKDFQIYGAVLPNSMTNQQMRDSDAYKTYLAYATGAASPKMKRKLKKLASPSKKRTFFTVDKGNELLSDAALLEEAQLKKALRRRKRETTIHQAGDSSKGVDFESEVPDEPIGKSIDTSEGTGLKPGVPDVSKCDSSKSKYESWGDSGDEDADEQETHDDKFVHTPEDYVPPDDETNDDSNDVTEEVYERINKELYGDVNVSLTDVEPTHKDKDDEEITIADYVNVNQEGVGNQVKDDAQATQKTEGPILSSSISSDYAAKYLNFDNIPSVDTEVVSMLDINVQPEVPCTSPLLTIPVSIIPEHTVANPHEIVITTSSKIISSLLTSLFPYLQQLTPIPAPTTEATTSTTAISESKTLVALQLKVTDLEKDVKELKILDDAMHKVIQKNVADIIKEHSAPVETLETLRQQYAPQKSVEDIRKIKREHTRNTKERALYHALMESILEDEDAMDEGVADKLKKRKPDDADKDEGPSVGSDQGLKR
ncbi:hypothetical protein Tco_0594088 [Tanacetum coccineum]